jgi:dolichol kinase
VLITFRSNESFKNNFLKSYDDKNRYKRRVTHIIPALVVIPIYLGSRLLSFAIPNWEGLSVFLILLIGLCFIITFSVADIVRIRWNPLLPEWASKLFSKGLRKEEVEHNTFTTTSAMVLAFSPWILASLFIFMIVALITSISDAMAAIMGFRFGKHNFPSKSTKTVEGYLGGIITTFGLVLICCALMSSINPLYIVIIGSMLAGSFFLVDVLNIPIDDNKINPQVVGITAIILIGLIGL